MAIWYNVDTPDEQERLTLAWPGAPIENLELAEFLLDVAKGDVLSYAPAPGDDEDFSTEAPIRYVFAQLQQAKNLWAAGTADENGNIGTEGYSFVPRPLDKTIRGLIRPKQGAADAF